MGAFLCSDKALYDMVVIERKNYLKKGVTLLPSLYSQIRSIFIDKFETYIVSGKHDGMVRTGMDVFTFDIPRHTVTYKNTSPKVIADKLESVLQNRFRVSCELEEDMYFIKVTIVVKIAEYDNELTPLLEKSM